MRFLATVLLNVVACGPLDIAPGSATGESKTGDPARDAACLAGGCNVPGDLRLEFMEPVDITPTGCTAIKSRAFALSQGSGSGEIIALTLAACDGDRRLVASRLLLDLDFSAAPVETRLATSCQTAGLPVTSFDADSDGAGAVFYTFTCGSAARGFDIHAGRISIGAVTTPERLITRVSTTNPDLAATRVTVNTATGLVAVTRVGAMHRLDFTGAPLGATVPVSGASPRDRIIPSGTSWVYLHRNDYGITSCSRVLREGILACSERYMNISFADASISDSNVIFGIGTYGMQAGDFNPSACSLLGGMSPWESMGDGY
ncbi:hypothetical protein EBZ80_25495, partial [bacterium]|nr:hypothetical protein [bacterium]